jgi:hypothetical protein
MSQKNYLDLDGLTAYDRKIKQWFKSSVVDITDNAINALFVSPAMPYVIFTAEEDNSSIGLAKLSTSQKLEYSTDTTTWNTFNTTTDISLNNDDKVYIRGILNTDVVSGNYTQFKMTGKISASGNCNALWNYQDLEAPLKKLCGYYMFYGCSSLTSAPDLPNTELASSCYRNMFQNCTSLTISPELPATVLVDNCYRNIFNGCTNLSQIKCLATDVSASNCINNWVTGVASTGTFIKQQDMNKWPTGNSGIPRGWTIVDVTL